MAIIQNYNDLLAEVQAWSLRDDVTTDVAAGFIRFGEDEIYNKLRVPSMEVTTTDYNGSGAYKDSLITTSGRDNVITFPANLLGVKDIYTFATTGTGPYAYGDKGPSLRRYSVEEFNALPKVSPLFSLWPKYFARDNLNIMVAYTRAPVFVRTTYWARPPYLSASQQTNVLFAENTEMFLHAALIRAAAWLKKFDEAPKFQEMLNTAASAVQSQADSSELSGSSVVSRSTFRG